MATPPYNINNGVDDTTCGHIRQDIQNKLQQCGNFNTLTDDMITAFKRTRGSNGELLLSGDTSYHMSGIYGPFLWRILHGQPDLSEPVPAKYLYYGNPPNSGLTRWSAPYSSTESLFTDPAARPIWDEYVARARRVGTGLIPYLKNIMHNPRYTISPDFNRDAVRTPATRAELDPVSEEFEMIEAFRMSLNTRPRGGRRSSRKSPKSKKNRKASRKNRSRTH